MQHWLSTIALTATLVAAAIGCGAEDSRTSDVLSDARARIEKPTGTWSNADARAVVASYLQKKKDAAFVAIGPGATPQSKRQSAAAGKVGPLFTPVFACDGEGKCQCAGGGTYAAEGTGGDGEDSRIDGTFERCRDQDGELDAKLVQIIALAPILQDPRFNRPNDGPVPDLNMFLSINGKWTDDKGSRAVDLAAIWQGGAMWMSVTVPDGTLTVTLDDKTLEVLDKDGLITCDRNGTAILCNASGAEPFAFEVDEGTERTDGLSTMAKPWNCSASCNVEGTEPQCTGRVTGSASAKSENDACREAKRDATQKAPAGCYARHCQCDCSQ
jgi:hypothetical protein